MVVALRRAARSGHELVCVLIGRGVETLVLAGGVEAPVGVEVAVGDGGAKSQDGFGSGQAPAGAGDVEAVGDQMTAGALDSAGGDRPAVVEGRVVRSDVLCGGPQMQRAIHVGPTGKQPLALAVANNGAEQPRKATMRDERPARAI